MAKSNVSEKKSRSSAKKNGEQETLDLKKLSPRNKRYIWDIVLVLITGISILCFVSCFTDSMIWLRNLCYSVSGIFMYVMPFIIIALAFLLRFADKTWGFIRRIIAGILFLFGLGGIISFIANNPALTGWFGKLNMKIFQGAFGTVGSIIINIIFLAIGVVLFMDFSVFESLGHRYQDETEVQKRKHEIRQEQREQNRKEVQKRRMEEVELSANEKRQLKNEERFQPIFGIGDTTIRENEMNVETTFNQEISATEQNAKRFKEGQENIQDKPRTAFFEEPEEEEETVERVESFLHRTEEKKEEDFEPDIRVPSEFFQDNFEQNPDLFVRTDEDDPLRNQDSNLNPDTEELEDAREPQNYTRTVITSNGKIMRVETDGDILSKKQIYNGDGEEVTPSESTVSSTTGNTRAGASTVPENTGSAVSEKKPEAVETEILEIHKPEKPPLKEYMFPSLRLLHKGAGTGAKDQIQEEIKDTANRLQQTLKTFGVNVTITHVSYGPSVTRYEIQPELGVKVSKILSLTDDIKLSLAAADIRIEAPIPGKSAIGIEVPNKVKQGVMLRDLLDSDAFRNAKSCLSFGLGKDIEGNLIISDIEKMPHVLVAGTTGSGKSVCINTMIMSILYHAKPTDVKMILVDPKVVEFSVYNGIPHLLLPVVTDPKKAASALNWAVAEMERRYERFAEFGVRGMEGFNTLVDTDQIEDADGNPLDKMPQILIIIDELADLMMVAANEVETAICRLAQKARAAGMHLVLATQRPSVDVITGLIKANIPSRIALSVSSGVDSRTILDMNGAEKLLGHGDMLYDAQGSTKPLRVQGGYVSDGEINEVVNFILSQGPVKGMTIGAAVDLNQTSGGNSGGSDDSRDEFFAEAGFLVIEKEKASIGMLQRAYKLGFNRAARIMDQLCEAGVVGEEEGTKPRRVLMNASEFEAFLSQK